jgi:cell division protein FtsQ
MNLASRSRPLLIALLLLALAGAALPILQSLGGHAVNSVRVAGEFNHVSRNTLERVVADQITKGFFEVDVEAVRVASRALPWVREASVRRVWPDSLHVAIVEREPVARWNAHDLMERDGTLFQPHGGVRELDLPELFGPPESEREVLAAHGRFRSVLGPLGGGIERLRLLARGGWRLVLANGTTLVLADGQDDATLKRFARAAAKEIAEHLDQIEQVDLRYAGGFAVRLKQVPQWRSGRSGG